MTNQLDTSPARLRELAFELNNAGLHTQASLVYAVSDEKEAQAKQKPFGFIHPNAVENLDKDWAADFAIWHRHPAPDGDEDATVPIYLAPQPSEPAQNHKEQPLNMVAPADVPQSNKGHGHVRPRKDGYLARCGGPVMCKVCQLEMAEAATQAPADVPLPKQTHFPGWTNTPYYTAEQMLAHREAYAKAKVAARREPARLTEWQPIESAPDDMTEPVVVRWVDSEGLERKDFDYKEDGCWMMWHDHVDHVHIIGGHGVSETPPYEHWMPLPPPPGGKG